MYRLKNLLKLKEDIYSTDYTPAAEAAENLFNGNIKDFKLWTKDASKVDFLECLEWYENFSHEGHLKNIAYFKKILGNNLSESFTKPSTKPTKKGGKTPSVNDDLDIPATGPTHHRAKANSGKQHAITPYDDMWEEAIKNIPNIKDPVDIPATSYVGRKKQNTGKQHTITAYDDMWEENEIGDKTLDAVPIFQAGSDFGTIPSANATKKFLEQNIKAPVVNVQVSTLGGDKNVSILIVLSLQDKKDWPNGILENSSYMRLHLYNNGRLEQFSGRIEGIKPMRKVVVKSAAEAVAKINKYIESAGSIKKEKINEYVPQKFEKGDKVVATDPYDNLHKTFDGEISRIVGTGQDRKYKVAPDKSYFSRISGRLRHEAETEGGHVFSERELKRKSTLKMTGLNP